MRKIFPDFVCFSESLNFILGNVTTSYLILKFADLSLLLYFWDRLCLDMQKTIKSFHSFVSSLSEPHGTSNFNTQSMIYSNLNYTNERHTGRIIYLLVWLPELHKKGMRLNGRNWDQPTAHFSSRCSSLPGWLTAACLPACLLHCIKSLDEGLLAWLPILLNLIKSRIAWYFSMFIFATSSYL